MYLYIYIYTYTYVYIYIYIQVFCIHILIIISGWLKHFSMASREERKIQDVTVEMAINGARAVKSMVTETWHFCSKNWLLYGYIINGL